MAKSRPRGASGGTEDARGQRARPPTSGVLPLADRWSDDDASIAHLYGGAELLEHPIVAESADGIYVRDTQGRVYVDCVSGTFDQPLGHRHPALLRAIERQAATLAYVGSPFLSEPLLELASKLVALSPPNLTRVHLRDLTGSTGIEGAVKIAQVATGRRDVITLFGSHHGQTALTTDLSGNAFRRAPYPVHSAGVVHVPGPNCYRCFYKQRYPECGLLCVDRIRDFIEHATSGSVACLVVEPVSGNGGNVVPPRDYFKGLRALCDEYGIVLIFDEVQTGMGRLGYMFAAEYFEVSPHMIVLGKGLGGPLPRGAILLEERLEKMPRYQHSFTGGSSLLSAATALATIEVLESPGFLPRVRALGDFVGERLREMKTRHPAIGDVRGLGLMWGIELVKEDGSPDVHLANAIVERGRDAGLILRSSRYGHGSVVKLRPPLIITQEQLEDVLDRLDAVLTSAT